MEELELAKSYFIKGDNSAHFKYIGPIGEYQKWYYILHKEYKNKACKEWRIKNLEHDKARLRKKGYIDRFKEKLNALRKVSTLNKPVCVNCGNDDIRVLTINHKNGDGAKERNISKHRMSRLSRDIQKGRTTSDLDVRCYNCNILYEYEQGRRNLPLNWKELYGTNT